MAIVSINESTARGYYQVLSTESKPVQAVQDGAKLKEIDTGREFEYSAANVNPVTGNGWWEILEEQVGWGVYQGLGVVAQATPDMTVNIPSGYYYDMDGSRHAVAAVPAQAITAADAVKDRIDLIYLNAARAASYLAGQIEIDAVAGARAITVAVNAAVGDTVTIEGEVFTAVAADPAAGEFVPGETAALTATALYNLINANAVLSAKYTATNPSAGVVLMTETTPGGLDTPGAATFTGTIEITNGAATESVAYVAGGTLPAVPSGGVKIAEIDVNANTTAITNAMITKTRTWTAGGVND